MVTASWQRLVFLVTNMGFRCNAGRFFFPALLAALLLAGAPAWGQLVPNGAVGDETATEPPAVIPADASEVPGDAEIRARIAGIFQQLDGLSGVSVQVEDGVVLLGGQVGDQESRERAEALAQRVAGAVIVVNDIARDRSVRARLQAAAAGFLEQLRDLAAAAPLLLLAVAVVALAFLLARAVGRAERLYERLSANWFVRDLLRQVAQLAIVLTGIIVALQLLDATALLGSVVGALGILGLAIGFATRDTVENYIASILLSIRQPFRHEDFIRIDEIEGKVLRLTPRATVLLSLEGNHVRVPNAKVFKATIVNFTRNPLRRFEFAVGVDTAVDLTRPRDLAVETLSAMPGVLDNPPPTCLVEELGDSSVILVVRGWMDQRENDFLKIRSEAQRLVKEAFDEAGIVMPVPIYNVNLQRARAERPADAEAEPAEPPAAEAVGDTARDRAVEHQIRAEKRSVVETDLLDPGAPTE